MNAHETGELTFLALAVALMFLPSAIRAGRNNWQSETVVIPNPKPWQIWLSVLAFLRAIAFVAIAFACEAAGTHWIMGLLCLSVSFLCSGLVLFLFGLRPRHFLH